MTGTYQHHLPQFLQRNFGVPRSGKPKEIWLFEKNGLPALSLIKETAVAACFYSTPSSSTQTLDDRITYIETPLARCVAEFKALPLGGSVDAFLASDVILHLAPRTAHLRSIFARAIAESANGVAQMLADARGLRRVLGLDGDAPSKRFQEAIARAWADESVFATAGLSKSVLEQTAFRFAKENFDWLIVTRVPLILAALGQLQVHADHFAKQSHNDALARALREGIQRDDLAAFEWSIEPAPPEGAILPDCVALAFCGPDVAYPFMLASRRTLVAVVMPIASGRLLVGRKDGAPMPKTKNLNAHAATCSHGFFLAASNHSAFALLPSKIGQCSTTVIDEALEKAFDEHRMARC